jgi:hypothetical protein
MIEVIYCMRRKTTLSHAEFLSHWEGVHAPIVVNNQRALRLARYERIVPLKHAFSDRVERHGSMLSPFDGVARLCWASEDDMRHAFESDEALAVQRVLARDEAAFVEVASSCRWIAQVKLHV